MNENFEIASEETSEITSEENFEITSEETSEESSQTVYSETGLDYTPYFDQIIQNQHIFIGLFVALVTLAAVGLVIKFFVSLMK